jgi:hypothetical protein
MAGRPRVSAHGRRACRKAGAERGPRRDGATRLIESRRLIRDSLGRPVLQSSPSASPYTLRSLVSPAAPATSCCQGAVGCCFSLSTKSVPHTRRSLSARAPRPAPTRCIVRYLVMLWILKISLSLVCLDPSNIQPSLLEREHATLGARDAVNPCVRAGG